MTKIDTGDPEFDHAVREIIAAIRTVALTEGRRIARNNARRRVIKATSRIRTLLDEKAPAIAKPRGEVKRTDPARKEKQLIRAGWKRTDQLAGHYAAAGVPVRRQRVVYIDREETHLWIPGWAAAIGPDSPTKLRAAKKSRTIQREVMATKRLSETK